MSETLILVSAIAVLSGVLVIVGIYFLLVLRDFRETLHRANKILGRVDSISEQVDSNVIRPASSLAGILAVLREGAQVVHEIKEIAEEAPETARAVSHEAREIAEVVKEEVAPAVAEAAKEVVEEIKEDVKEVTTETREDLKEVTTEAKEEVTETAEKVADQVKEAAEEIRRPEPMAAGSLAPRRRFFRKKK